MHAPLILWNPIATIVEAPNEKLGVGIAGLRKRYSRVQHSYVVVTMRDCQHVTDSSGNDHPEILLADAIGGGAITGI